MLVYCMKSKKNGKLDLVKSKSNLKRIELINHITNELKQKILELGDMNSTLQEDASCVHYVCNLFENIDSVILKGPEKKDLVMKLILQVFPNADTSKMTNLIEFCCDMKLISKIPLSKVVLSTVWNFLSKKLL
jgi:hypothetical protein